jgi:hypothetical protein
MHEECASALSMGQKQGTMSGLSSVSFWLQKRHFWNVNVRGSMNMFCMLLLGEASVSMWREECEEFEVLWWVLAGEE